MDFSEPHPVFARSKDAQKCEKQCERMKKVLHVAWIQTSSCLQALDVFVQLFVESMFRQRGGIAQDDELHAGAGDGHIHAAQVVEETDLPFFVGAHQADEDNVALLPLESVHGVDGDERPEGFEEGVFP